MLREFWDGSCYGKSRIILMMRGLTLFLPGPLCWISCCAISWGLLQSTPNVSTSPLSFRKAISLTSLDLVTWYFYYYQAIFHCYYFTLENFAWRKTNKDKLSSSKHSAQVLGSILSHILTIVFYDKNITLWLAAVARHIVIVQSFFSFFFFASCVWLQTSRHIFSQRSVQRNKKEILLSPSFVPRPSF